MGNQQTRKRHADSDEGFPPRKRIKFAPDVEYGEESKGTLSRGNFARNVQTAPRRLRRHHRISSIFHLNDPKPSVEEEDTQVACRCKSLDDGIATAAIVDNTLGCAVSCSVSHRGDYPTPWLEALFLPEYPARSTISEKSFIISNELGSGAFGRVFRAVTRHDRRGIYAIKIQDKAKILGRGAVLQVRREASLLRLIPPHVFICRLYATWQSRTQLFSVLQYPVGGLGDLFALWTEYGNFCEDTVRIYAAELACAVDFIHSSGIIYRDLKLENVILDAGGHVQIIDFGLAKQLRNGETTNTICGTLQYMSPCVAREVPYGHYVDWWSLAVVVHILLTGRYPYPNADAKHHSELKFIDYSTPLGCSKELGNLLDRLLEVHKERRLCSFEVIHAHPFFESLNFEDVEAKMYDPMSQVLGLGIPLIDSDQAATSNQLGTGDPEENVDMFREEYEFNDFGYFNDNI